MSTTNDGEDPQKKNTKQGILGTVKRKVVGASLLSSSSHGSTLFWIAFGLFGWYFPRSLIFRKTTTASILSLTPPYQEVGDKILLDFELNQPHVDPPTVDNFLLRSTAIVLPLVFYVLHAWYSNNKSSLSDAPKLVFVTTVISAFSAAIGMSEGCTVLVKLWVRRRRPNFYALCGFDVVSKTCTADPKHIREANFSFPSGHSSLVCCGMTFLVWYLLGTSGRKSSDVSAIFLLRTCLPWGWAIFVAASRLVDHWHHPSDVVAGLGLGFAAATIAYHHWYPLVWSQYAGIPRALLRGKNISGFSDTTSSSGSEQPYYSSVYP